MMVESSQQETMNPGFMLLDTCQESVPVILRELVLPDGFDHVSPSFIVRDEIQNLQQSVPVILRELMLPGGFDLVSPSFIVRDVTTERSEPRLTSCRTEM
ncbi:unnamed protein product [Schistosoma margrebowiei]|uniref:Uncharacterized protein n=1 Tax=Schistosoma margrebowiei TaxID=48269 RepID=A0A183MCD3_9TREM|nr:unnamed protein product [Schistosoma margrebowiei]